MSCSVYCATLVVVSFPHDRKLSHLGVLNPEWVVGAIYPILTSIEIARAEGLITLSDIATLLPSSRYPKEIHSWLIELMEAFELLFSDELGRLLVPARLPKELPEWVESLQSPERDSLRVELRFGSLAESVMSRFVVRKHSRALRPGSWWRHGIALKEGDCEAVIRAHVSEGKIQIQITGPRMKRQAMLHGLLSDFRNLTDSVDPAQLWVMLEAGHSERYDELVAFAQNGIVRVPRLVGGRVTHLDISSVLDLIGPSSEMGPNAAPIVGVYMRDQINADRGSQVFSHVGKVGNVTLTWEQHASKGMSTAQLAADFSTLRGIVRNSPDRSDDERDLAVGKLASAEAAAKADNGPGVIESVKGVGEWVIETAIKKGLPAAAECMKSAIGL